MGRFLYTLVRIDSRSCRALETHLHSASLLLKVDGPFFQTSKSEAWVFADVFPFTVVSLVVTEKSITAQKYEMQVLRNMTRRRHPDVANRKV